MLIKSASPFTVSVVLPDPAISAKAASICVAVYLPAESSIPICDAPFPAAVEASSAIIAFKNALIELSKINIYDNTKEIDNEKAKRVAFMLCKKYGLDIEFNDVSKITDRFKNMDKQDVINELTSMKESVRELNKQISDYIEVNIKTKNKEQER